MQPKMSETRNNNGLEPTIYEMRESFFHNELTSLDDFHNNLDHRINSKVALSMKKAT